MTIPERYCDIVMKGGITSGLIYPRAVAELAEVYRFKNIGGTSTGAIAATLTAASEYRRLRGGGDAGFAEMKGLARWLSEPSKVAGKSNMFALFQPQRETAPLFNVFASALRGPRNFFFKAFRVWLAMVINFPLESTLSAIPGWALFFWAAFEGQGGLAYATMLAGVILATLGIVLAVGDKLKRIMFTGVPRNFYGFCSGLESEPKVAAVPLVRWLADMIDRTAGRDPAIDPPLTFGDLWGHRDQKREKDINLLMLTSNLTHGRPYSLPLEDPADGQAAQFYFRPEELMRLMPQRIVDYMVAHAPDTQALRQFPGLLPLPHPADIPVAFAARLSLSYPILLSAVPLHTVDNSRVSPDLRRLPERCWFSDGGLASNFPVHLFDQPLPRWPTFAINLRPPHPDFPDEEVWMPRHNRERGITAWQRWERGGRGSLFGFLRAMRNVATNWMDNEQIRVPGYRDRVAHVTLRRGEGGLNLNMPPEIVRTLSERGYKVGCALKERYATIGSWDADSMWDNHRWVRYRSTMYVVEQLLTQMSESYRQQSQGERTYRQIVGRAPERPPFTYRWYDARQREFAVRATEDLIGLVDRWRAEGNTFGKAAPDDDGPPRPYPVLRIAPRI
ncbi:MAG: hypothetical protein AB7G15_17610 [Alphaproteobacteria bacterium]